MHALSLSEPELVRAVAPVPVPDRVPVVGVALSGGGVRRYLRPAGEGPIRTVVLIFLRSPRCTLFNKAPLAREVLFSRKITLSQLLSLSGPFGCVIAPVSGPLLAGFIAVGEMSDPRVWAGFFMLGLRFGLWFDGVSLMVWTLAVDMYHQVESVQEVVSGVIVALPPTSIGPPAIQVVKIIRGATVGHYRRTVIIVILSDRGATAIADRIVNVALGVAGSQLAWNGETEFGSEVLQRLDRLIPGDPYSPGIGRLANDQSQFSQSIRCYGVVDDPAIIWRYTRGIQPIFRLLLALDLPEAEGLNQQDGKIALPDQDRINRRDRVVLNRVLCGNPSGE